MNTAPQKSAGRDVVPGFGAACRACREAVGLTLADVAAAAGTELSTVSKVERGTRAPSLRLAVALAAALGRPLGDLLAEADQLAAAGRPVTPARRPRTAGGRAATG